MKKIKCSSDNSSLVSPSLKLIAAAAISCAALGASADTYYWKPGSTQGLWTDLSNWSTESVAGAAAGSLPGSSDELYGPASYNFDLENQERTVSKCKQESDFDTVYCFFLEKGTFKVTGELRRARGSIDINDGATLLIPSGATIYTGVYQCIPRNNRSSAFSRKHQFRRKHGCTGHGSFL